MPRPLISAAATTGPSDRRRRRRTAGSPGAATLAAGRSRLPPACHHTIAAPASAAATHRLPGLGQTRAEESATSAAKPSRPTPMSSHGRSRWFLIASAAIESSTPSSGITSQAAT
jgi:hypothetical protein